MTNSDSRNYHQIGTSIYDESRKTMSVFQLDAAGGIPTNTNGEDYRFDNLIVQNVQEMERERYQTLQSSDENKLYSLGQDHRIYSIAGVLGDTDLDIDIEQQGHVWDGRSYKEFVRFVEDKANIGVCAERRWIVALAYADRILYGAFVSISGEMDASTPHMATVTGQFYVAYQEHMVQETLNDTNS